MKFSVPEPEIEGTYSKILGDSRGNNVLWYFIGSHQSINIDLIENYRIMGNPLLFSLLALLYLMHDAVFVI